MAVWINKTAWARFQEGSDMEFILQVYDNGWKFLYDETEYQRAASISYDSLSNTTEVISNITKTYLTGSVKRKILQSKTDYDRRKTKDC